MPVHRALEEVGDIAGSTLYRQVCAELSGPIRIAVIARDPGAGRRWLDALPPLPGVHWVPVHIGGIPLGIGVQDRLLSAHALLFVTPVTAPLGAAERDTLRALADAGAPRLRGVSVVDAALLTRLSDNPEAELAAVYSRLNTLLPADWVLIEDGGLRPWVEHLNPTQRIDEIGRFLLNQRIHGVHAQLHIATTKLKALRQQQDLEEDTILNAQRAADRLAAHTLAIVRRQTEQLDLDLAAFLRNLEDDLPAQIHGVSSAQLARRAFPHWLSSVVESWMTDRLGHWRSAVLEELEELELPDAIGAELLVPALHSASIRAEHDWLRPLGTTAALGGAAALLAVGLWLPSLLALSGGIVWSSWRPTSEAADQTKLLQTARAAIHQLGDDASRLIHEQLRQIHDDLKRLATEAEQSERATHARACAQLERRIQSHLTHIEQLTHSLTTLQDALGEIG